MDDRTGKSREPVVLVVGLPAPASFRATPIFSGRGSAVESSSHVSQRRPISSIHKIFRSQISGSSLLPPCFLALGTFAIGTEGFMIAPLSAHHCAGSPHEPFGHRDASWWFSPLVMSLSSPITTVMTASLKRRSTLLVAMTLFTTGNLVAAYSLLLRHPYGRTHPYGDRFGALCSPRKFARRRYRFPGKARSGAAAIVSAA